MKFTGIRLIRESPSQISARQNLQAELSFPVFLTKPFHSSGNTTGLYSEDVASSLGQYYNCRHLGFVVIFIQLCSQISQ
jgi:hypothetical protein